MRRIIFSIIVTLLIALAAQGKSPAKKAQAFFERDTIAQINLNMSAAEYAQMQPGRRAPKTGLRRFFTPAASQPATAPSLPLRPELPAHHNSYPWSQGTVEIEGERFGNTGLRYKGNTSYSASLLHLNKPMKLDFNRVLADQKFNGLSSLNLGNNSLDPSHVREMLSYELFRIAGVPSPRATLARVRLNVDGIHSQQDIGFYSVVEEVDDAFLKQRFGSSKGLLLKPEGAHGLPYAGGNLSSLRGYYEPKSGDSDEAMGRWADFLRLIHRADVTEFADRIESFLPMEEFLGFIAVNVLLSNYDSFLSTGHNFYVYIEPQTQKIHFIPWDLNFSFGGYVRVGNAGEMSRVNIRHFWVNDNRLLERLLDIPAYKTRYLEILGQLNRTAFSPEVLCKKIAHWEKLTTLPATTKPALAASAVAPKVLPNLAQAPDLQRFVRDRHQSIKDQLAGKADVYPPRFQLNPVSSYIYRAQQPAAPESRQKRFPAI